MKKAICFVLVLANITVAGQSKEETKIPQTTGEHAVSLVVNIPVGDFSSTHLIGIGADYSPARHVSGIAKWKHWGLTYNAGVAYYFGKKEIVSRYSYHYPGYFFIHAFGGVLYNPIRKGSITLSAGPALGIYMKHTRFNIGSKLELSYFISKNIALGPGIIFMKEHGADPLWSAILKGTMIF